jgi:hypothetical protein
MLERDMEKEIPLMSGDLSLNQCAGIILRQYSHGCSVGPEPAHRRCRQKNVAAIMFEHLLMRMVVGLCSDEDDSISQTIETLSEVNVAEFDTSKIFFTIAGLAGSAKPELRLIFNQLLRPPMISLQLEQYVMRQVEAPILPEWNSIFFLLRFVGSFRNTCQEHISLMIICELEVMLTAMSWSWDNGIATDQQAVIEKVFKCTYFLAKVKAIHRCFYIYP